MKKNLLLLLTILCAGMLASCSDDATSSKEQSGTPLIILDTDIGSSTDDLFAMEMLYEYQRQGRCTLLGIIVDRQGQEYAAIADVMNTYFGYGNTPIGLIRNGIKNSKVHRRHTHVQPHPHRLLNPARRMATLPAAPRRTTRPQRHHLLHRLRLLPDAVAAI